MAVANWVEYQTNPFQGILHLPRVMVVRIYERSAARLNQKPPRPPAPWFFYGPMGSGPPKVLQQWCTAFPGICFLFEMDKGGGMGLLPTVIQVGSKTSVLCSVRVRARHASARPVHLDEIHFYSLNPRVFYLEAIGGKRPSFPTRAAGRTSTPEPTAARLTIFWVCTALPPAEEHFVLPSLRSVIQKRKMIICCFKRSAQ